MSVHQACYAVATMARVLGVSTSGYYAWRKRGPSKREREDAMLQQRIEAIHAKSRGTYGAPRIHAELRASGLWVGCKRVARLMRRAHLAGICRRRRKGITQRDAKARPALDLVQRDFTAQRPDRLWVADIKHIPTLTALLYLSVVVDACSRRVVGWAMAGHLRTELVLDALNMAIWQRRPEQVIHHSDQGTQYTAVAFSKRCKVNRPGIAGDRDC